MKDITPKWQDSAVEQGTEYEEEKVNAALNKEALSEEHRRVENWVDSGKQETRPRRMIGVETVEPQIDTHKDEVGRRDQLVV